jgi:hypothetical protein
MTGQPPPNWPPRLAIPKFDHETAQAWIERIQSARDGLVVAEQAGFITDHELAQQLDQVLAETHTIARGLRNTIDEHGQRLAKLERELGHIYRPLEILRHPLRELGERRYQRRRDR